MQGLLFIFRSLNAMKTSAIAGDLMMLQSICERLLVLFYQFQPVNQGTVIQR